MLIDAHSHVDMYGDALESALEQISQHRILTISCSMGLPSYEKNLRVAEECEWVVPAFGVHPWEAPKYVDRLDDLPDVVKQAAMLGEIGLDHHYVEDASQYPAQRTVFEFFLAAAREQDKLVNLHVKGAEVEALDLLNRYDIARAIVHWYSGPLDAFLKFVDRGVFFSMGVGVLDSEHVRMIAQRVPSELLLTETDNPGGIKSVRGAPGMPLLIREVFDTLAEVRKTTVEAIERTVQANLERCFRGDRWLTGAHHRFFGGTSE